MKDFKDVKIVACFMVHNEDDFIYSLLENLDKYAEGFYVNLNDATNEIADAVASYDKTKKIVSTSNDGRWNQGLQRDNTIRMLDNVKPDIVLFPDADETYDDGLMEVLEDFWKSDKEYVWFRLWYYWNSAMRIRNDGIFKKMHHCRAFKWREGITFIPYQGYALPTNFTNKKKRYVPDIPMHHWGYMREEDRRRKYERDKKPHYLDERGIILKNV